MKLPGKILTTAQKEKDLKKITVLRIMAQIANVYRHALIASDYAIKLINIIYPNNIGEVEKERKIQIELMKSV